MNWFFSAFWGCLCASAMTQLPHNAAMGRWGHVFGGLLVIVWTGGNSYLWAKRRR